MELSSIDGLQRRWGRKPTEGLAISFGLFTIRHFSLACSHECIHLAAASCKFILGGSNWVSQRKLSWLTGWEHQIDYTKNWRSKNPVWFAKEGIRSSGLGDACYHGWNNTLGMIMSSLQTSRVAELSQVSDCLLSPNNHCYPGRFLSSGVCSWNFRFENTALKLTGET